jgi:ankyrin repeat protein
LDGHLTPTSGPDQLINEDYFSLTLGLSDAMISAIEKVQYKVVARLLERGEDPSAEDHNGWCVFHYAVRADSKRVMRQLLGSEKVKSNKGVLEQKNRDGATPLHFASSMGFIAMAKLLLNAGVDKNAVDNHNRSPLFVAVESNKFDIFELLSDQEAECIPFKPDRFKRMRNDFLNRKSISVKTKKS